MSTSQNLPARHEPKTQVVAGAPVAALVPRSIEEAFRLSGAIAASGLAPRGIDKPEQIMVAIMAGAELGLAPFQSLQSFAIVNNRPTMWGDALVAVVRSHGCKVRTWFDNEAPNFPDEMKGMCEVVRPDGEIITAEFSVADAKRAKLWTKTGPWTDYPKRMLKNRARAFALRDGCADMLRGIAIREEAEDYQEPRRGPETAPDLTQRLSAQPAGQPGFSAAHVDAEFSPVDASFVDRAEDVAELAADDLPIVRDDTPAETETFSAEEVDAGRASLPAGMKTGADLLKEQTQAERPVLPDVEQTKLDKILADLRAAAEAGDLGELESVWAKAAKWRGDYGSFDPIGGEILNATFNGFVEEVTGGA